MWIGHKVYYCFTNARRLEVDEDLLHLGRGHTHTVVEHVNDHLDFSSPFYIGPV